MSEPDSTSGRRPPTIDLTATELDQPASGQESGASEAAAERTTADADAPNGQSANPAAGRRWSRTKTATAGAVAGALAIGAIGAVLWLAGLTPSRAPAALPSAPGSTSTNVDEISAQLKTIEGAIAAQQQQAESDLATRMAAAEAQTKSLGDSLAALNRRVDDVATATQNALAQAKSAAAAAAAANNTAQVAVQPSDLDALSGRIAALESAIKALSTNVSQQAAGADDRAARLTIAAEALRATVERGASYQAELATVTSLGADQAATAALEPFAAGGVPTADALAHELSMLTPALLQASGAAPSETTFLGRLETNAQKLVHVTPIDAPAGDDPASIIARIRIDAAHADVAGALADIARLPEAERAVADPWTEKADARNAAIAASQRIVAAALAALGQSNPQ